MNSASVVVTMFSISEDAFASSNPTVAGNATGLGSQKTRKMVMTSLYSSNKRRFADMGTIVAKLVKSCRPRLH